MSSSHRFVLASLLLASGLGCATARNYEDPVAPVYAGGSADRRDPRAWLSVVAIAVISTVVSMSAFLAGMAIVGPNRASVLASLEVVVTLVLAIALLGERLTLAQWAGAALILGAVVFQNLKALRRARALP